MHTQLTDHSPAGGRLTRAADPEKIARIHAGKMDASMSFNEKVWALTARIPAGSVTTYAAIARALGSTGYRAVGQALHRNPYAPKVPCHRVVGSNGKLTGFAQGIDRKAALLKKEGLPVKDNKVLLGEITLHEFK